MRICILLMRAAAFLAVVLEPAISRAWDYTGHMLVDEIAWKNTGPEVHEQVTKLVQLLDNRYNNQRPYNFITSGCYMDDMRAAKDYAWSKWHYIDAPYTPDGSGYAEPDPPHVVWAIQQAKAVFHNPSASDADKAIALAMLIHFVGDIHQPLHCVDWNDQGGNGYFIAGIPFSDLSKSHIATLHAFWDRAYRFEAKHGKVYELYYGLWTKERPQSATGGLIENEADQLMADYPASRRPELVKVDDPHVWAKESYEIGCRYGYPPGKHPDNNEAVTLSPFFVYRSHVIACERVALAGYRLANLLNELFGQTGK